MFCMRTPFARPMFSLACVVSLALLACGGSEPQGAGASGVAQSSSGGDGTSPGASSSSSGSSSGGGSSSSGETGGHVGIGIGGGASSSGQADSGSPPLSCMTMTPAPQATSVACSADEIVVNNGGVAAEGVYVVSGWWRCSDFDRVIGSARIYRENGVLAMRFELAKGSTQGAEDTIEQFTWQLDLSGDDAIVTRTSVCRDPEMREIVEVGTYSATSSALRFQFADHAERWTRVANL